MRSFPKVRILLATIVGGLRYLPIFILVRTVSSFVTDVRAFAALASCKGCCCYVPCHKVKHILKLLVF